MYYSLFASALGLSELGETQFAPPLLNGFDTCGAALRVVCGANGDEFVEIRVCE